MDNNKSTLPDGRLGRLEGWGMVANGVAHVFRPTTPEGITEAFHAAASSGKTVGLRGAGRSYGDASLNNEGIVLDLTRMNRILNWDPTDGLIDVEPGVSVRQLWQYIIEDGWWPPVVSGTMFPTIGGCAAMNIHGKNNFKAGPIGDHIVEFELLTPAFEVLVCNRDNNAEIFFAAIGGAGLLGIFTRIRLQMKRIYSGYLDVEPIAVANFDELFDVFDDRVSMSDYLVGWVDCFAKGPRAGRGLVHRANYLDKDEDSEPERSLRVESQELSDLIFGVVPKSVMWRFMKPFVNDFGMKVVNEVRCMSAARTPGGHTHRQTHAEFAFLLDYIPGWKNAYKPNGLIQYQSFVPAASAKHVFQTQLELTHRYGLVPYLGVFKRHRSDNFLLSHGVDGYSFALDFAFQPNLRAEFLSLTAEMNRVVLDCNGKFYLAKDSTLHSSVYQQSLGLSAVEKFRSLKQRCDPENILQTNIYRRLFAE